MQIRVRLEISDAPITSGDQPSEETPAGASLGSGHSGRSARLIAMAIAPVTILSLTDDTRFPASIAGHTASPAAASAPATPVLA